MEKIGRALTSRFFRHVHTDERKAFLTMSLSVLISIVINCSASSQPKIIDMTVGEADSKPSQLCAVKLRAFVTEIDQRIDSSKSIEPLQETIKKYFPLFGCNLEEAGHIARESKYFYEADQYPKGVVIVLRQHIPHGWGLKVTFGLDRGTGNSFLPAALVDLSKWEQR
jgi:hypothetical protein